MKIEIDKTIYKVFPELESKRLLFRNFLLSDSKELFLIRSDDDVMRFMDISRMESINDSEKWIQTVWEDFKNENGITWGIIDKSSNRFVGYFGFWRMIPEHCRAEIGYALNPKYWSNGYMTESLKTITKYGFGKIKLHSIEANVNPNNKSSIKLLEKIGFKKEAYFRENYLFNNKFNDSIIYSLLEKDLTNI